MKDIAKVMNFFVAERKKKHYFCAVFGVHKYPRFSSEKTLFNRDLQKSPYFCRKFANNNVSLQKIITYELWKV